MGIWHNGENEGGPALVAATVQRANGTVADVTADILHPGADITIQQAGRQTELTRVEAGQADLVLENAAGTYTPGAVAAPTSLALGMPFHWKETVGRRSFDLFDGALNQPEASFENLAGNVGDQIAVTAVDWMGQQQQGRTFVSTLAEHILYNGGSALTAYYPMGESGSDIHQFGSAVAAREPLPIRPIVGSATNTDGIATYTVGTEPPLLGDDLPRPLSNPLMFGGAGASAIRGFFPQVTFATPITVTAGQYLTLAWWVTPSATVYDAGYQLELSHTSTDNFLDIRRSQLSESPPGVWRGEIANAAITWKIGASGQTMNYGSTQFVSVTISPSPGSLALYTGSKSVTGTVTGSPPASFSFNVLTVGSNFVGSYSHVQIYKGTVTDWTYAKHLAQYRMGSDYLTRGLRWQRTDERLTTLAQYAGLSASQLTFDRGSAYMPQASLAGKTFLTAAAEAVDTEQGRLYSAGNGSLRFHNRATTRYDL